MRAEIKVGEIQEIGNMPTGLRRIIPITGGVFEGERISGTIMPGGADWQIVRNDGVTDLEARYTLLTDDGALITVVNHGLRHGPPEVMKKLAEGEKAAPDEYYFRTVPVFETENEKYSWLNRHIFVCSGERLRDCVIIDFYLVK
jgi:hypothetical protein